MTTRFEGKEKALEFHLRGIAAPLPVCLQPRCYRQTKWEPFSSVGDDRFRRV